MSTIKFRLAAKTDVGLVRTNNEDNFQVASDLSAGQMHWLNNEICSLGEKGALLVVADGMGGMNAGEVASELAINTVREYFSPENLTPEVMKNRFSIEKFMNEVIVAADARIKQEAKTHPETRGMGTTIVIGWVLDGKLYVSWCGDSRAYVYNPAAGLHQITKDHSYVQSLVDKGAISREDAFDFPDSNIITRSLSDGSSKAKPESLLKPYTLCDNDIILLCTDGLNGMIRDNEMEAVIRGGEHNMDTLVDDLIHAACEAEGSDNITICLCQILQGGAVCNPAVFEETESRLNGGRNRFVETLTGGGDDETTRRKGWLSYVIAACVVLILAGAGAWYVMSHREIPEPQDTVQTDSLNVETAAEGVQPADGNTTVEGEKSDEKPAAKEIVPSGDHRKPMAVRGAEEKPAAKGLTPVRADKPAQPAANEEDELSPVGTLGAPSKREEPAEDVITPQPKTPADSAPEIEDDDELSPVGGTTREYTVQRGDTYFSLSNRFGTTVDELKKLNGNKELKTGDTIVVPAGK